MNRLQFVHHNEIFENRNAVLDYISEMLKTKALYAEPAIFKYGTAQNPNIILAIGSVGDGTLKSGNKIFTIDTAKIEEDVEKIAAEIGNNTIIVEDLKKKFVKLIASCGFNEDGSYIKDIDDDLLKKANSLNDAIKILSYALQELDKITTITAKDTNTIELHSSQDTTDGTILSGDVKVSAYGELDPDFNDNIIVKMNDGLFASADIDYNDATGILKFTASSKKVDGTIGVKIIEKNFKIGLHTQLISVKYNEDTETIILTLSDEDGKPYIKEVPCSGIINEWDIYNKVDSAVLLQKDRNKIGKDILSADVILSSGNFNILKKSNTTGGLYVKGSADNIQYKTNITVENALDNLANVADTNLTLAKQYTDNQVAIEKDRATNKENSLENALDQEIVRAKASEKVNADALAIVNGDNETNGSIKKSLKDAKTYTDEERNRAIVAENALQGKIDVINGNEAVVGSVKESLKIAKQYTDTQVQTEADRAKAIESGLQSNVDIINGNEAVVGSVKNAIDVSKQYTNTALNKHQVETDKEFEEIQNAFDAEVKRATMFGAETNTVRINITQAASGTTIGADSKISNAKGNIILPDNGGLYANVDLSYNLAENSLYFTNGTTDKPIKLQLSSGSLVQDAYYDPATESIVLVVKDASGSEHKVTIPVGSLITEWNVGRKSDSAIVLTKERVAGGGIDTLFGSVELSTDEDNMLKNINGSLKVSNLASGIIYNGTTSIKTKIDDLIDTVNTNKQTAKDYTDSSVKTEADRAKAAEQAERDRAMVAETVLQNSITSETNRATQAEIDETNRAKAAEADLNGKIDINTNAINIINGDSSLKGSINYMGKVVSDNMTHLIEDERDRAMAAEALLKDKLDVINGGGSGSLSDLLEQAKKYTDQSVAPIPGQIAAAKNEAIAAAAIDATTKATNAKNEAIAAAAIDATTKANQALADAKLDATSKANDAEANAIAAAAIDASNKANQALADAKVYSDTNQIYTTGATVSADNTKITVLFKNPIHNFDIDLTSIIKKAVDEAVAAAVAQTKDAIKYVGLQSDSTNVTVDNDASPRTIKVDVYKIDNGMFS